MISSWHIQSREKKSQGQLREAQTLGNLALVLNIVNIVYTGLSLCIFIGLGVGLTYHYTCKWNEDYGDYGEFSCTCLLRVK